MLALQSIAGEQCCVVRTKNDLPSRSVEDPMDNVINEEHRGVQFTVHLNEDRRGTWTWSFSCGEHYQECKDRRLNNREITLAEARDAGRRYIDQVLKAQE